jgi:hypothetical protein
MSAVDGFCVPTGILSRAPYRRFAPIGGCFYKHSLDVVWQELNILRRRRKFNVKMFVIG